jgi:hypothetical protein
MRRLRKAYEETWSGGNTSSFAPANLDHVYGAKHLAFRPFKNPQNEDVELDVRGWVSESSVTARDAWIANYSDHSLLYFEVEKLSQ